MSGDWLIEEGSGPAFSNFTEGDNLTLSCAACDIQGPINLPYSSTLTITLRVLQSTYYLFIIVTALVAKYKKLHTLSYLVSFQVVTLDLLLNALSYRSHCSSPQVGFWRAHVCCNQLDRDHHHSNKDSPDVCICHWSLPHHHVAIFLPKAYNCGPFDSFLGIFCPRKSCHATWSLGLLQVHIHHESVCCIVKLQLLCSLYVRIYRVIYLPCCTPYSTVSQWRSRKRWLWIQQSIDITTRSGRPRSLFHFCL